MYERGADVVFAAAGTAGSGFSRAELSEAQAHLWAIGADSDQYLDVDPEMRPHVLTSTIKRFDVAVYEMVATTSTAASSRWNGKSGSPRRRSATPGPAHRSRRRRRHARAASRGRDRGETGRAGLADGSLDAPPAHDRDRFGDGHFRRLHCRYDGPTSPNPAVFRFTFANLTGDGRLPRDRRGARGRHPRVASSGARRERRLRTHRLGLPPLLLRRARRAHTGQLPGAELKAEAA